MSVSINRITRKINQAGKMYKNNLVGKTFLILYEGQSAEIMFGTDNFRHLCGVESTMPAKDFYKKYSYHDNQGSFYYHGYIHTNPHLQNRCYGFGHV